MGFSVYGIPIADRTDKTSRGSVPFGCNTRWHRARNLHCGHALRKSMDI
jgi:hypothetical protein